MGSVRMGPPTGIIGTLQENFILQRFIETGTYLGETTYWASQFFKQVTTIENSQTLYEQAIQQYTQLATPSLFWLDAHWCGGVTFGDKHEFHLLE